MIKGIFDVRITRQYLDIYLQEAANDRHVNKPANGCVIKGYVLDAEEAADDSVIGIVDKKFRRARNLAA